MQLHAYAAEVLNGNSLRSKFTIWGISFPVHLKNAWRTDKSKYCPISILKTIQKPLWSLAALIFKHSCFQVLSYHASAQQSEVNKIMVTTQFV